MRTNNLKSGLFMAAIVVLCAINLEVYAQEISKTDLEQRAVNNFSTERFDKAAADYEMLSDMFPKDTKYAYFLGRSYLHSNQNIIRATELLKYAATRNYGEDAYFYLGRAYLLNYQFDEANLAFKTFEKTASTKQLEKYDVDYWIGVCDNARQSTNVAQVFTVDDLQLIPKSTIESAFRDQIEGKYVYVPDEFKSDRDIEDDYQTLMFISQSSAIGDYLYFDSRTRKGKQTSDIYRVRRITAENFSLPEVLPATINTQYDETYPYFDESTGTLYFSSKGHNTSGGFDIFKTSYDSVNNAWKTPEKLNFPINTPYDDFLYTSTRNDEGAIFLTNRNTGPREVEAFTLKNSMAGGFISPTGCDEMYNCALLSPSAITINEVDPVQDKVAESVITEPSPVILEYKKYSPVEEYAQLISEGMDLQSKSDSLSWSAKEIRLKAEQEKDYLRKSELIANQTTIDQESKRLQRLADEKFLLADVMRGTNRKEVRKETEPIKTQNIQKTDIAQYSFKADQPVTNTKIDANEAYQKGMDAAKITSTELNTNFSIVSSSPYSTENPIPLAVIPAGLIYRIQLGAFSNMIPENAFGGLAPLSKEKSAAETKYYVGYFSSVVKAREALEKVKKYGYPDAFLVSYYDSKKISIQQAREIEFAEKSE